MADNRTDGGGRTAWLWVLVAVIVGVGAWQLVGRGSGASGSGREGSELQPITGGARPASGALGAYLQYVDERGAHGAAVQEPALTAEGVRRLADAIGEVGNRNVARSALVRAAVDSLHGLAARLEGERDAQAQTRVAREAFESAAAAIARLQEQGFPTLASMTAELRGAVAAVSPRLELDAQRAATQSFFERAATVLRNMSPQAV